MSIDHPDWLAIGTRVLLRRTSATGRVILHQAEVIVTRHTKASVFVIYPGYSDEKRFARKGENYYEVPCYLNQPTRLLPLQADS